MPRRKLEEKNIRKLTKTGRGKSFSSTIPIEMTRRLKWRECQKLVVRQRGKKIIIEDWPVRDSTEFVEGRSFTVSSVAFKRRRDGGGEK